MINSQVLHMKSDLDQLQTVYEFLENWAESYHLNEDDLYDVRLAVSEAVTNIVVHGYQGQEGQIEMDISKENDTVVIHLRDQAPIFDPTSIPPPDPAVPIMERAQGGMGVFLMTQSLDEIQHTVTSLGGNELTLVKTVAG